MSIVSGLTNCFKTLRSIDNQNRHGIALGSLSACTALLLSSCTGRAVGSMVSSQTKSPLLGRAVQFAITAIPLYVIPFLTNNYNQFLAFRVPRSQVLNWQLRTGTSHAPRQA